jgi:hypothetical protein
MDISRFRALRLIFGRVAHPSTPHFNHATDRIFGCRILCDFLFCKGCGFRRYSPQALILNLSLVPKTGRSNRRSVQLQTKHLPSAPFLLLTYVYLCVNMPPRVIDSPRGGHMHGGAELRRAAKFLHDIEKNLAADRYRPKPAAPTCSPKPALQ